MMWELPDDPFDASEWVSDFTWEEYWNMLTRQAPVGPARYAAGLALFKRIDELWAEGEFFE